MASTPEVDTASCAHLPPTIAAPTGMKCEECESTTSLRLCLECGHVGCCESQAGHARDHALERHHPVIKSLPLEPGHFTWCYECDRYV